MEALAGFREQAVQTFLRTKTRYNHRRNTSVIQRQNRNASIHSYKSRKVRGEILGFGGKYNGLHNAHGLLSWTEISTNTSWSVSRH